MKDRIKELRKKRGLSQTDFANRIEISRSALSKIESGENKPSDQTIKLICNEFSVNKEWLINGTGEMEVLPPDEDMAYIESLISDKSNPLYGLVIKVMKTYNALDENNKKVIKSFAQSLLQDNSDPTVEEAEAEYIKNCSGSARRKDSAASNSTDVTDDDKKVSNC